MLLGTKVSSSLMAEFTVFGVVIVDATVPGVTVAGITVSRVLLLILRSLVLMR